MKYYEIQRRRIGREGRWISRAVRLIFALTILGALATVGIGIYAAVTLEPADIGRFLGEIVSGYSEAAP